MSRQIGLIAGSGQFPLIFAKKAVQKGYLIHAVAYLNEADPKISEYAESVEWLHLGQIKRLIKYFHAHDIAEAVMIGAIQKTRLFNDLKPDAKALKMLAGLWNTHDDGILRTFAGLLEKEGILIRESTFLLPDLLAPKGCWTKRKPSRSEKRDIRLGWKLAKEIGRLDIGQCIVVAAGSVLAVEAIEGTDATISRGAAMGHGQAVVVKVCKPNQDTRFDIPAIGLGTIESMQAAGARALAIEAGRAVVFDREEMIRLADKYKIAIVALNGEAEF
jgi:DUF1009 family protein